MKDIREITDNLLDKLSCITTTDQKEHLLMEEIFECIESTVCGDYNHYLEEAGDVENVLYQVLKSVPKNMINKCSLKLNHIVTMGKTVSRSPLCEVGKTMMKIRRVDIGADKFTYNYEKYIMALLNLKCEINDVIQRMDKKDKRVYYYMRYTKIKRQMERFGMDIDDLPTLFGPEGVEEYGL